MIKKPYNTEIDYGYVAVGSNSKPLKSTRLGWGGCLGLHLYVNDRLTLSIPDTDGMSEQQKKECPPFIIYE